MPTVDGVNGPDDYLAACGDEALSKLIADSESGAAILDQIATFIRSYLVVSSAQLVVIAVWVVHTYLMQIARTTPYLSITSPEKQSGKTRLLEVLEVLVLKPWMTGRISPASLYRKIDADHPTLLLDESDSAFNSEKEYAEALRGILNTGYRHKGRVSCCVGEGTNITIKDFSTFCAKAIAGIGHLPDTVADRSIPIRAKRRSLNEKVEDFDCDDLEPETKALRQLITDWTGSHIQQVASLRPARLQELSDRQQQVMKPLLQIAEAAGGDWLERLQKAAVELFTGTASEDQSIGVQLLADIKTIFAESKADDKGEKIMSSEELISALIEMEDRPWAEFGERRKPITKDSSQPPAQEIRDQAQMCADR